MTDEINIADEIYPQAVDYAGEYNEARDRWLSFFNDPTTDTDAYITALNRQVAELEESDIPQDECAGLVMAAFWGASADMALNRDTDRVRNVAGDVHDALVGVWGDG